MLDDMPERQSTSLVADSQATIRRRCDSAGQASSRRPSPSGLAALGVRKSSRPSALGMLLKPIGIALGVVLSPMRFCRSAPPSIAAISAISITARAVHADNSVLDIFFGDESLPPDAVDLVVKDVDGTLAQGRGEQVGDRQIRQRHDPDARRRAGAASRRRRMRTSTAPSRLPSRIARRRSRPMPTGSSSGSALTWC